MTFALDTRLPLGRLGLLLNFGFFAVVLAAAASLSHWLMAANLPGGHAQREGDKAVAALVAAEGAQATTDAAKAALKAKAEAAGKKAFDEGLAYGRQTWFPFEIFLAITWALMGGGYLSVAVQRRMNDAGQHGLWLLVIGHLGAWALASTVAFHALLADAGKLSISSPWMLVPLVGAILVLPAFLGGSGHGEEEHA
ncbi:MAG: hypothetical protein ACK5VI_04705 [Opitutia bacterium]|jgi:hypothetical protein